MLKILNLTRSCVKAHSKLFTVANVSNFKRSSVLSTEDSHLKLLTDIVNGSLEDLDWKKVRSEIITNDRNISAVNVDSYIVGFCIKGLKLKSAKSYISFLKKQGLEINNGTSGKYLRLLHDHCIENGTKKEDEKEILDM